MHVFLFLSISYSLFSPLFSYVSKFMYPSSFLCRFSFRNVSCILPFWHSTNNNNIINNSNDDDNNNNNSNILILFSWILLFYLHNGFSSTIFFISFFFALLRNLIAVPVILICLCLLWTGFPYHTCEQVNESLRILPFSL